MSKSEPKTADTDGGIESETANDATIRNEADNLRRITAHYAPDAERPLGSYAVLVGAYLTIFGGTFLVIRARGHELPTRLATGDVLLIGIASHKLSRLIAKDKVTSFLRAPFTRYQEPGGQGEVEEEAYGHGLRLAIGELLVCPYCLAQWVASGLTLGLVAAPRSTRLFGAMLTAHSTADFLQIAYRAAEDQLAA